MSGQAATSKEKAAFIVKMIAGLEELAATEGDLALLAYLLEVARHEAEARAGSLKP